MRHHFTGTLLTAVFLMFFAASAHSQVVISSTATCPECRFEIERVLSLGESEGPGTVGHLFCIARDDEGRFLVNYPEKGGELLVFDGSGRYIETITGDRAHTDAFRFIREIRVANPSLPI